MEAVGVSETSVNMYQNAYSRVMEDSETYSLYFVLATYVQLFNKSYQSYALRQLRDSQYIRIGQFQCNM